MSLGSGREEKKMNPVVVDDNLDETLVTRAKKADKDRYVPEISTNPSLDRLRRGMKERHEKSRSQHGGT
jgi:hypothetical protein